jgi:hypothetical protein
LQVDKYEANIKVLIHLKNKYLLHYDENNFGFNNKQLNVLGATAVLFPTVYGAQKSLRKGV